MASVPVPAQVLVLRFGDVQVVVHAERECIVADGDLDFGFEGVYRD